MDEYAKLKEQLDLIEWPSVYFFKFIVQNETDKVARITALFDDGLDLRYTNSKTGKYVSVSVKEMMMTAESVIEKYKKAAEIEGIVSL